MSLRNTLNHQSPNKQKMKTKITTTATKHSQKLKISILSKWSCVHVLVPVLVPIKVDGKPKLEIKGATAHNKRNNAAGRQNNCKYHTLNVRIRNFIRQTLKGKITKHTKNKSHRFWHNHEGKYGLFQSKRNFKDPYLKFGHC